jgi:methionine-rich copper-binding protein CopC
MSLRHLRTGGLLLVAMLALVSCSEDDATSPAEDTTAPLVVGVTPQQNQTNVALDESITVTFSEDMAPGSAAGQVTLSHGTVSGTDWTDARHLVVEHSAWPQGTEVTVTVGAGVTDVAGNGLAQAFAWSFWTWTDQVLLLATNPAQGATDVPINSQIWLQFSEPMNGTTLPDAITVTSADKAVLPYTLGGGNDDTEWTLTMDDNLPATTAITVTVTTAAQSAGGDPLAAAATVSFTTGSGADLTPPHLVAIEPASGTAVATDVATIRLTFDEPILDTSLQPSLLSGQFMFALADRDNPGVWTENQTVFTLGLSTPLVPGAIFRVEFDSFADVHGNVNHDGFVWQVTVAGTAQHYPVRDGWLQVYAGAFEETGDNPSSGLVESVTKLEVKTGGEFWNWHYDSYQANAIKSPPTFVEYDRLQATAPAILMLGFHEVHDAEDVDSVFDPAVEWLRLPVATGNWSGTSTLTQGAETLDVDYTVTVLPGTFAVTIPGLRDLTTEVWLGCRKVVLYHAIGDGIDIFSAGTDTLWYAPGAGLVREFNHEDEGTRVHTEDKTLLWAGYEEDWPQR